MSSSPSTPPTESKPKPQGIPMGVAVVVLFILVVIVAIAFGGLWHYASNENSGCFELTDGGLGRQ
jgi:uncharacterized membrane protein YqiK